MQIDAQKFKFWGILYEAVVVYFWLLCSSSTDEMF
jgi:hypothetical protein